MRLLLLLIFSLFFMPLHGEVFLLSGGGAKGKYFDPVKDLQGELLFSESIEYNGIRTELEVFAVSLNADMITAELRGMTGRPMQDLPLGTVFALPPEKGWQRMFLFFGNRSGNRVTMFSMRLPAKRQEQINWPENLPLPPWGKPEMSIYFTGSGSFCGRFSFSCSSGEAMRSLTEALRERGFEPQTGESAEVYGSGGEIFISGGNILLLTMNAHGHGIMHMRKRTGRALPGRQ